MKARTVEEIVSTGYANAGEATGMQGVIDWLARQLAEAEADLAELSAMCEQTLKLRAEHGSQSYYAEAGMSHIRESLRSIEARRRG